MVAGSKNPASSHVVQRGKALHKKYEEIVKALIQLEPDDWESFINEPCLNWKKMTPPDDWESFINEPCLNWKKNDTTRASETSSGQTQTYMEKIDQEEKTAIP